MIVRRYSPAIGTGEERGRHYRCSARLGLVEARGKGERGKPMTRGGRGIAAIDELWLNESGWPAMGCSSLIVIGKKPGRGKAMGAKDHGLANDRTSCGWDAEANGPRKKRAPRTGGWVSWCWRCVVPCSCQRRSGRERYRARSPKREVGDRARKLR